MTCDPEYYRWNQWFFLRFLEAGPGLSPEGAGRLVPQRPDRAGPRAGRGRRPPLLALRQRSSSKRDLEQWFLRITAYADELLRLRRASTGRSRVRIQQRNWIGRSRGRRDRLRDGVRRHAGGETDPRLHDAARHALRRDLHGPGAGAPAGRRPHRRRTGRRRSRPTSREARRETEIERAARPTREKTGVFTGALRDQSVHRRAHPDLDRRLRADRLRHRRDHGGARPRRARLRVRAEVRPADPARRAAPRRRRRRTDGRRLHRPRRRRAAGQQRRASTACRPTTAARPIIAQLAEQGFGRAQASPTACATG